jgi:peroxiredoxin
VRLAGAAVAVGQHVPDVELETHDGRAWRLSSLRGRPLLVVCVRYYG